MPTRKITLVLKSHMNEVNLGLREVVNATKMRVEMMRYVTTSSNEKYLHFDIPEFTSENLTIDDKARICSKVFALDTGSNTLVRYSNLDTNSWDVDRGDDAVSFKNLKINIFINNELATTQITSNNPLILTLHFQ